MNLKSKIFIIAIGLIIVFLWNKYAIKTIIKTIISMKKEYNFKNPHKKQLSFIIKNEKTILNTFKAFYWSCYLFFVIQILKN